VTALAEATGWSPTKLDARDRDEYGVANCPNERHQVFLADPSRPAAIRAQRTCVMLGVKDAVERT